MNRRDVEGNVVAIQCANQTRDSYMKQPVDQVEPMIRALRKLDDILYENHIRIKMEEGARSSNLGMWSMKYWQSVKKNYFNFFFHLSQEILRLSAIDVFCMDGRVTQYKLEQNNRDTCKAHTSTWTKLTPKEESLRKSCMRIYIGFNNFQNARRKTWDKNAVLTHNQCTKHMYNS